MRRKPFHPFTFRQNDQRKSSRHSFCDPGAMPDAPKRNRQPLSASERGPSSVPVQTPLQTTIAKSNNGQSVALQGATLAFTAQVGKQMTGTGLKPGTVVNTSDTGARKAAALAGVANKVQTESKDGATAEDVRGCIRQFSSQEPMPTSASQPSLPSTNPQHLAAHLAVGRSAPQTVVHHILKHSGRTTE